MSVLASNSLRFFEHRVILLATKKICRSTTGQPTQANQPLCFALTKELDPIVRVTAIQYVNDPTDPLVIVFGEDAKGVHHIAMADGQAVGLSFDVRTAHPFRP